MKNNKKKIEEYDYERFIKLFDSIESMKDFRLWFGKPCPNFEPLCPNCRFWNRWNKLKSELAGEMFQ